MRSHPRTCAAALFLACGSAAQAQNCMWTLRDAPPPPAGFGLGGALVYDSVRSRLVSFGGALNNNPTRNTSEWTGTGWVIAATTGPSARVGQAMAYDSARGRVVLFGGSSSLSWSSASVLKDTWAWDGTSWTFVTLSGPAQQFSPVMAYDSARDRMVMYYGASGLTFEFDGTSWNAGAALPGPGARSSYAMTYDTDRQRIVLAGGYFGGGPSSDIWEYDGIAWTLRTPVGASPPGFPFPRSVAYDSSRHRLVVVMGAPNATWEFDSAAATWTQRSINQPAAMWPTGSLAYDSNQHKCLLPGGVYYGTFGDMWEYDGSATSEPSISQQPASLNITVFDPAVFTVSAPGSTSIRWYHNLVPLNDGISVSGSSTDTLTLAQCGQSASGSYSALIQGPCGPFATKEVFLSVNTSSCYANCDGSTSTPALTANDFQCFLNTFAQGLPYANCDGNTTPPLFTANDFQCFLNSYAQCN